MNAKSEEFLHSKPVILLWGGKSQSKIIQEIALDIKNNFTGIFRQVNPFPAFLAAYFRQVTADEIEKACMGKSILPSAILHMKTCGTY